MRITGSKLHRVWKCPASAVLPQVERDQSDSEPARDKGKAIHAFLERVKAKGRDAALAEAPKELHPLLEALDLENIPVGLACEVAFAWNWKTSTARELGRSIDRGYDEVGVDWSCEIPCTLDVVGVEQQRGHGSRDLGYVGDYKSGHSKYPAPDLFAQTLLGACCVRSVYGCDDVVVELIHIHDNGGHHAVRRTVNDWDLDVFEREITAAMAEVERASEAEGFGPAELFTSGRSVSATHLEEGLHCQWCDAFTSCPAKLALVRSIPEHLLTMGVRPDPESGALTLTPGVISVRNAAASWMMAERIQDIVNRIKEEICSIGAFEPIPLPDGREIGHVHTERRSLNGRIAAEVLERRYGREERDKRVSISVSMSELRFAVSSHLKQGEKIETKAKTGVYDGLLAEIERLGGLELYISDSVKPHVPKKKRLPPG